MTDLSNSVVMSAAIALGIAASASVALAQSVETSTSSIFWCVDREGIKRLRNYPCGANERDLEQIRMKTTTVHFNNANRSVQLPAQTSKKEAATQANEAHTRMGFNERRELAIANLKGKCGELPRLGPNDPGWAKAMDSYSACHIAADKAFNIEYPP